VAACGWAKLTVEIGDDLTSDFDAHIPFSFRPIPEGPPWANMSARVRRWFFIAFAESWLAVFLFRLKTRLRSSRVPILPGLCDTLSRAIFRVSIGNAVEIGPGLMMTHGNVVIDGRTKIGARCQINPWVTIGLSNSRKLGFSPDGPTIGDDVHIGTGAKILGPVNVGDHARIGANAVVVKDVPSNRTVVGIPAHLVDIGRSTNGSEGAVSNLVSTMLVTIVEYRLHRRSLESMVASLEESFKGGGTELRSTYERASEGMRVLRQHAAGRPAGDLEAALAAVEGALTSA
jgi:serine O-acetyltransferase